MPVVAPVRHGGDLAEARLLFPRAPEPWIDLSTGINPVAYPLPAFDPAAFARLPSPDDCAALRGAAARAYGARSADEIVAAPGTQSLIGHLPRLLLPAAGGERVAIVGPTYAEHARAWRQAGVTPAAAVPADLPHLAADSTVGCVVLVNPNNPDGRIVPRPDLVRLADALAARGGWLVVDEAFVEFEDAAGAISLVPQRPERAIVLRSFGKTYGLAGLRLGFAVAAPDFATRLRDALGPWAVSGPAIALGQTALADGGWLAEAARARSADAARLDRLLSAHGEVVGGTRLFRLLRTPHAAALFDALGNCGIWLRRFDHDGTILRCGLPAPGDWGRVEGALRV